jgi:hypothetical protein
MLGVQGGGLSRDDPMKSLPTIDLERYALWCARIADECAEPTVAAELRKMSRELIDHACREAQLRAHEPAQRDEKNIA